MRQLTQEDFNRLLKQSSPNSISIFMPTYRVGSETQQGRIILKNLLKQTEEILIENGMRPPDAKKYLDPCKMLILDNYFWQFQLDGLALFLSQEGFEYYSLPLEFEELLIVNHHFHLKPLLPWIQGNKDYYILAISQNTVRVLKCNRSTVEELDAQQLPENLAEALRFDDPERQVQFHTNTLESKNGRAAAIYHGNGDNSEDPKDRVLRYFHIVDKGMKELLRLKKAPLIISGVEYLLPIYREANTYAYLLDDGIPGNPEEISSDDLHKKGWEIVKSYFDQGLQEALEIYGPFRGTGRTSNSIIEAVPAAYNGRVETLFVADRVQQWGRFDPESSQLELHEEPEIGDEELLDFVSMQTIKNGGNVFIIDQDKIPDGDSLAALFRY